MAATSRTRQDRIAAWMPIFLLVGLAVLAVWLNYKINNAVIEQHKAAANSPESFIENFTASRFDAQGVKVQELVAARGTHFPAMDRLVVEKPVFANRPVGAPGLDVRADKATLYGKKAADRVEFAGHVRAQQPAYKGQLARTMETSALTAIPQTGELTSNAAVKLTQGDAVVETKGLKVNTKTQTFAAKGAAQIILQPKP